MIEFAHSVPGRLRIRVRHIADAEQIRALVLHVPSVTAATLNQLTGSLVITYDPTQLSQVALWSEVQRRCASHDQSMVPSGRTEPAAANGALERVADAAFDAFLRYVLERSAAALLRAVI
jgi:hypothetical protein